MTAVLDEARRQGHEALLIDPSAEQSVPKISVELKPPEFQSLLRINRLVIDPDSVSGVWWRLREMMHWTEGDARSTSIAAFIDREWRNLLQSFVHLTPHTVWLNKPSDNHMASQKLSQLVAAASAGLQIPLTAITNDSSDLTYTFPSGTENLIYKTMTGYSEHPNMFVYTSRVPMDEVLKAKTSVAAAPCQFQMEIGKNFEIRVTLVGDMVFAIGIDSQNREDTKLDWRRNQSDSRYFPMDLDSSVASKLKQLMVTFGLRFATADLIVTRAGETVFLDLNPMGQWLWLERKLGIPITHHVVKCLATPQP